MMAVWLDAIVTLRAFLKTKLILLDNPLHGGFKGAGWLGILIGSITRTSNLVFQLLSYNMELRIY